MPKLKQYWISREFVPVANKHLWHVWQKGVTHSNCVCAFENEDLAINYCNYLNKQQSIIDLQNAIENSIKKSKKNKRC